MTASQANGALVGKIFARCGVWIESDDAQALRRAQLTLQRWAELECGDGNDYASWAIERDETTQIPYMARYPHSGKPTRHRIPDRERGALKRVESICKRYGLNYFHQTDPRGCALYVAKEALNDTNYNYGVAC